MKNLFSQENHDIKLVHQTFEIQEYMIISTDCQIYVFN